MDFEKYATKKTHKITLFAGMIASVAFFAVEMYIVSAATIITTTGLITLIKRVSETPIEDERDMNIAKDSIFKAFTWTGFLLGVLMGGITVAMGFDYISYPSFLGPIYLTWGGIMGFGIVIEFLKRKKVIG